MKTYSKYVFKIMSLFYRSNNNNNTQKNNLLDPFPFYKYNYCCYYAAITVIYNGCITEMFFVTYIVTTLFLLLKLHSNQTTCVKHWHAIHRGSRDSRYIAWT